MTSTELEHAETRMRQKWYDLVMAEQKGASLPVLERMYNSYMLAVEEYNRCSEIYLREHAELPVSVSSKQKRGFPSDSPVAQDSKKAS